MSDFSCLCCSLRLNYLFNHLSCSFWPARSIKSPTKKNKSYVFVVKRHDFGSKSSQNPIFLQFFVSNHKIILKVTFKTNIQNQKNDMTENQKCKKNVIVFFDKNDFFENNYTYIYNFFIYFQNIVETYLSSFIVLDFIELYRVK